MDNQDVRTFRVAQTFSTDHALDVSADVAQENISPVSSGNSWSIFTNCHPLVSRYFVGVEHANGTLLARLLASKELLEAYPEDDAFGHGFINIDK